MTDQDGFSTNGLAQGERLLWSGRSQPVGVIAAVSPNLLVAAFAASLALGFAPATASMGLVLSPVVDSALRTVTPLPTPRIFIERAPRAAPPSSPVTPIALQPDPGPLDASPRAFPSDVDLGVGAALLVAKTILLYLAAATAYVGLRAFLGQTLSQHAVTDTRLVSRHRGGSRSVSLGAVRGLRVRKHPFGTSITVEVSGQRRPFLLLGLSDSAAGIVERAVTVGLSRP